MDLSKNGRDPQTADGQFPDPPADFNALRASPNQLRYFGLPPRPDRKTQPAQFARFEALFGPPVSYLNSEVVPSEFLIGTNVLPSARSVAPRTRWEDSPNWCGASINANRDETFVFIASEWMVLTPEIPDPSLPPPGETRTYRCSTWVGLDGQRRYIDSSLPQVGTSQAVKLKHDGSTELQIQAWSQWWVRGNPNNRPKFFKFFKVDVDDQVACALQVWGPSEAVVYAVNFGKSGSGTVKGLVRRAITPPGPPIPLPGGHLHTPTVSGATAEWILERPTLPRTTTLEDLPNFADFRFDDCYAYQANPSVPGWPWVVGESRRLEPPTFIRLFDRPTDPLRTRLIAMPHRVAGSVTSLRISYGGFKP